MVIVTNTDFTSNALADLGVTIVRTPITKTYTGNGDEIRNSGTPENIIVIFHRRSISFEQKEEGLKKDIDGYIMTSPSQTINRDDLITYNNETFRVISVMERGPVSDVAIYKYCELQLIE